MAAVKSGNHIYVEGIGNTLEVIATDINDPAYCTWDAGNNTLTVFGTAAATRYLRIRNNGDLTINGGETLAFSNATNDDTRFYVDAGGHLIMNDDSTVDFSITNSRPYFTYFYGRVTCNADIPNDRRPFFNNFYRMYLYETANNNNFANDICDFTGARIGGSRVNNGYAFFVQLIGRVRNHIFKDMIFDERLGSANLDTYGFHFPYGLNHLENITFENILFNKVERAFNCTGGGNIRTKNCTFDQQSASWSVLHFSNSGNEARDRFRYYGDANIKPYGQYFAYHEGGTWLVGNNNNKMVVSYGGQVLIKDCDYQRTTGDSLEIKYQGRVLEWTGNTYADANPFDTQQNGERSQVYRLELIVQDQFGNPIEDADVNIKQFEEKEQFKFTTASNGKLHAIHDLEGAMLTHRSFYTNTASEIWSSAAEPHSYEIIKEGYRRASGAVVMDSDKSVVVTLTPELPNNFSNSDSIAL